MEKKNKTTKHSSLQGQRLFHDYNRKFVVAEAALPVGLENLRKWRTGVSEVWCHSEKQLGKGWGHSEIESLVYKCHFLSYTPERKQNIITFGANVCGRESSLRRGALFWGKMTSLPFSPILSSLLESLYLTTHPGLACYNLLREMAVITGIQ